MIFSDVDVSTTVERVSGGGKIVVPAVIRSASMKNLAQLEDDIKGAKEVDFADSKVYTLIRWFVKIPAGLRRIFFRMLERFPKLLKKQVGTVMMSSVGMFTKGAGWGIPIATHTVNLTVGGIVKRPVMRHGSLTLEDHICLTLSVDHDLIDGAPAARFTRRFINLLENPDLSCSQGPESQFSS
jgi:pyruvate/2-oxoglutarate dehydrogenase complex dihydrolipoamide acyltransferase (E2) component